MVAFEAGRRGSITPQTAGAPRSLRLEGAPFGIKPQHARVRDGQFHVARRASDLVDADAPFNIDRLSALLTFTSPSEPASSLFKEVVRVPPDTTMTLHRDGGVDLEHKKRILVESPMPAITAADEIWKLVVASVRQAIDGSRHVAVATGGGVDSSALLAAAISVCRGANQAEIEAIALHFGGEGDDRPYLRELEKELGIVAIRVLPSDCGAQVLPLFGSATFPCWGWSAAADLTLFRAARDQGADLVLTGIGGDDLLDGSPRVLGDELIRGRLDAVFSAANLECASSPLQRIGKFVFRPIVAKAIPRTVTVARRRAASAKHWPWAGPTLRHYLEQESARWTPPRFDSPAERVRSLATAENLVNSVELCEELASYAGVRAAHPYLDETLVEFVSKLPPRLLLHADRFRGLFRLGLRGRVPTQLRLRPTKAVFLNAWREMVQAAGGVAVLRALSSMEECGKLGLVDPAEFRLAFAQLGSEDGAWTRLWLALGVEGFLRARAALAC